jgi:hypothetical protein
MDDVERRRHGKALVRRYLLAGVASGEITSSVMHHPDLAADPPSARTVQTWIRQLRHAPGGDLIDDDVRAAVGHPLEDHRKAQLAAIAGRVERHNLTIAALQDELAQAEAAKKPDRERIRDLRAEIREEDKRVDAAWKAHAAVTGVDSIPLEAHLAEAEARARLVEALEVHSREFTAGELRGVVHAFQTELARRDALAAEQRSAPTRRQLAAQIGLGAEPSTAGETDG